MVAAYYGKTGCVRILAEKEARMKDEQGRTALMFAAGEGHLECVKILVPLEKGMKTNSGDTAKSYASGECRDYLRQFE